MRIDVHAHYWTEDYLQVLSACPQSPYAEDGKKATEAARFTRTMSASSSSSA
jgi:hypothetical protein